METILEEVQVEKYEAYKDSDVEWLDEIPAHWELLKSKYLWKEKINLSETGDETLLSVSQYLGVNNREIDSRSESLIGYKKVSENDLVINIMLAWLGGLGLSPLNGVVSPAYGVYELQADANPRFLHYLYRTETYIGEFARRSRGVVPSRWRMYTDDFGQVLTLLPPKKEQTKIARFLDQKTAAIDKAIGIKEKQIELLKERRQILIHQVVTRGLNPNALLKDSGVEWIGKIPAHWESKKMTHITSLLVDGTHFSPKSFSEGQFKYVTAKNIKENGFDFSELTYINEKDHRVIFNRCPVKKGDVLYIKDGATAGVAMVNNLDEEFSLLSSVALIRANQNEINAEFLKHYLNSNIIKTFIQTQIVGGAITRLTLELINRFKVIVPPIDEQYEISEYIENINSKIQKVNSIKEKEIEKLKEYKATLINSAVTGKFKVC